MKPSLFQNIGRTATHGIVFGLSAVFTIILVSLVYATASWGSLPTVQSGSGLTATAWNDLVAHVNQSVKQASQVITVSGSNVGIGTINPQEKLDIVGTVIQNGLKTTIFTGYTAGNSSFYVDIPVQDEGGGGAIYKVEATFAHYFEMTYNTLREFYVSARGTNIFLTNITEINSSNGGSWTASKPNATTLRITKNAGVYTGGGKYYIKVTSP
ncbi:MAG: hypothetical protein PHQ95_04515 [Candidatus Gracilibacteria bacterium]|nr:hypothetical protein [Candidatus Gracilibacteria bacterium]